MTGQEYKNDREPYGSDYSEAKVEKNNMDEIGADNIRECSEEYRTAETGSTEEIENREQIEEKKIEDIRIKEIEHIENKEHIKEINSIGETEEVNSGENTLPETDDFNSNRYMHEEHLKKKHNKKGFKVVLALVMAVLVGFSVGFGYRFAAHFYSEKVVEVKTSSVTTPASVGIDVDDASARVTQIAEKYSPAIVSVLGEERSLNGYSSSKTIGTGVIFSQDQDKLYILSNEHVVKYGSGYGAEDPVYISVGGKRLYEAEILGTDSPSDLAVVSIKKADIPKEFLDKLVPVTFADSDEVRVGEWVVAMGNPLGYIDTTTFGIVSGKDRKIGNSGLEVELIQLDAAINSGNSGGATFNIKGEVIGVNTIKIKETGVEGLAFAIASNDVKNVVSQIMEKGRVERVFLGIIGMSVEDMAYSRYEAPKGVTKGVFIETAIEGTAAEKAGLRQGDIIQKIDDVEIVTMLQLSELIKTKNIGDKITITIRRGDEENKKIEVTLGIRPDLD